jgi:integrase
MYEKRVKARLELTKRNRRVKVKTILTQDEQNLFLSNVEQLTYKNLFIVALNSGLRVSEILALSIDDIDFGDLKIKVNKVFSGLPWVDERNFPITSYKYYMKEIHMNDSCRIALLKQQQYKLNHFEPVKGEDKGRLLFTTTEGAFISLRQCNMVIEKVISNIYEECNGLKNKHITMNVLRNTYFAVNKE